ncbi:hypothetical protein, partial [Nitratifractor sp.]
MRLFFNVLCVLVLWYPSHAEEREGVEVQRLRFDADGDGREDRNVVRLQKIDPKNAVATITVDATRARPLSFRRDCYVNFSVQDCGDGCIEIVDADYGVWSEAFTKRYRYVVGPEKPIHKPEPATLSIQILPKDSQELKTECRAPSPLFLL